ncbi:MAG: prepilin peptidase [Pseudomonadota bacterium]
MPLSLFNWTHLAALAAMLLVAIWQDASMRRIPNALVLWGSLTALGLSVSPHGIGLGSAIAGGMVGFLGFLVLYLLRVVGAGDVKLVGATGLFVGHPEMLWVNLLILLAGGVLAIVWALLKGQLGTVLQNLKTGLTQIWLNRQHGHLTLPIAFPVGRARMPYAVAIGAGTATHVLNSWPTL